MKRVVIAAVIGFAAVASADPHHVLVLRSEGNADAGMRAKIDAQILRLAKSIEGNVEAGEISFSDASAAVGCTGVEAQCRDDVLATIGVDELVATTVTASPAGETKIIVRRIGKGTATREAMSVIPAGQPIEGKLGTDLGPMFGVAAPAHVEKPAAPTPITPAPEPAPEPAPAPTPTTVTALPNNQLPPPHVDQLPHDNRRPELAGMITGGGLVLLSFILWGEASSIQGQINNAPTKTPADFKSLQDLESSGDGYAAVGNLCFLGGVAVGAVAGYFFWRDHRNAAAPATHQARIAPAVFAHGGGVTLTIGGAP